MSIKAIVDHVHWAHSWATTDCIVPLFMMDDQAPKGQVWAQQMGFS